MFVENVMFIFQQQLHGRFFTEIWMTSSLEFDAPARCMSTTEEKSQRHGTVARTEPRTLYLSFRVLREKGEIERGQVT